MSIDVVVTGATIENIIAPPTMQRVVPIAAGKSIASVFAMKVICACPGQNDIIKIARENHHVFVADVHQFINGSNADAGVIVFVNV